MITFYSCHRVPPSLDDRNPAQQRGKVLLFIEMSSDFRCYAPILVYREKMVMSLLIKNALLNNSVQDIYIEGEEIRSHGENLECTATEIIDAGGKIAVPSFWNCHTHAAMTLLRGYGDEMPLQEWLTNKIWPTESKMCEEDIYWGAKLACLEMIKSGTTFFNDMYWFWKGTARAVEEMGIRAAVGAVFIDGFNERRAREQIRQNEELFNEHKAFSSRVIFSLGPHAIYTVSPESLLWCREFSETHSIPVHLHLSETEQEVKDCLKLHNMRPAEYLEKLGLLSPRVIAAHCVWLNDHEIEILKEYDVKVAYNPVSNMKLAVGSAMPYNGMKKAGITVTLGTDGCSSNNNLDMMESMKFASLLQKFHNNDCCALPDDETLLMATSEGARSFGLRGGKIAPGYLADLLLIDHRKPEMTPLCSLVSNLVYSAGGSVVDTVICAGKIVMKGRIVQGEEEILARASEVAKRLGLS
jgi:5-methylthioadenosine/S-adenosylhomocysteine deaminase